MSHSVASCTFPAQLIDASRSFERFYLARHSGRRLTWQPGLGNADVRVKFKARKHDLNVATFALVILLLFEDILDDQFLTYEVWRAVAASVCALMSLVGNQIVNRDPGRRAQAPAAVARVRKIQDPEEAPARARSGHR